MKNRPISLYGLIYLIISVILKIIILLLVSSTKKLTLDYYICFPMLLAQDLIVAIFIFFTSDCILTWSRKLTRKGVVILLSFFAHTIYLLCLIISFLGLKFYTLLGCYLNYGLIIYGDQISNFSKGILHEIDAFAVFLFLCVVAIFVVSILIRKKTTALQPKPHTWKFYFFQSLAIIFYITAAFIFQKFYFANKDLYALDRNPVIEILTSMLDINNSIQKFSSEYTLNRQNSKPTKSPVNPMVPGLSIGGAKKSENTNRGEVHAEGGAKKTRQENPSLQNTPAKENNTADTRVFVSTDSLVNNIEVPAALVNSYPGKILGNFNIVIYKMESTSGLYLGTLNEEFKPYTPNLDRIIKNSLVMVNHYNQEPASLKTLYTMLTGKYSYKTREWREYAAKAQHDKFVGEILSNHGYYSLFIGTGSGLIYLQNEMIKNKFDRVIDKQVLVKEGTSYSDYGLSLDDRVLVDRFARFLDEKKSPFFLFLCPVFPHHPYLVPDKKFIINQGNMDFDHYKNSLYYSDAVIGAIYQLLEDYNILENTIFILMPDHGEAFYQHPRNYVHSIFLYEENVYTFCLFSNPVLFPAQVYTPITRNVDVAASLLDLLGVDQEAAMDGVSIFRPHTQQYAPFYTTFTFPYLGLRDGAWKYIINRNYNSEELYNLNKDPRETINLAADFPDLCLQFRTELLGFETHINRK